MPKRNALRDVDPVAITICKQGANRKRIFLRKSADTDDLVELQHDASIIRKADDAGGWSTFYCVVAEPGWEEDPGMTGDRDSVDVWADEGEIRKAAHRLLKNRGYVNAAHDALAEEGCHIVESAVALADLAVEGPDGTTTTIRKGTWYVGIEASPDFRAAVDAGEITGMSLEGTGVRVPLEKAMPPFAQKKRAQAMLAAGKSHAEIAQALSITEDAVKKLLAGDVKKAKDASPDAAIPNKPGVSNWVEKAGGLPRYIRKIAEDLHAKGHDVGKAIQLAVGIVRNWAEGKGNVSAKTRAKAAAALAEWERKKASSGAKALAKSLPDVTDAEVAMAMGSVQADMASTSLLQKIAKAVGLADDDPDLVELQKADAQDTRSFASILAESQLDQALPRAFDALQRVVWWAFSPMAQEQGVDAAAVVAESADQFATYLKGLVDTLPAVEREAVAKELATLETNDEEDFVDDATRQEIETIKKQGEDTAAAVKALSDGFQQLLDRVAPKEQKDGDTGDGADTPNPADLKKAMDELDGKFGELAGSLDTIAKSVEQLADSGTTQPDDGEDLRKQKAHPMAGIL